MCAITTGGRVGPGRPGLEHTTHVCTNHVETRTNDTGANILDSIVDDVANTSGAPRDAVIQALNQASQNHPKLWQWHLLHGDGKSADPMERRLPTGLRFVTSAALAPLGYCLSCDGYDEALAAHPGSHLLSSIVLNLRTAPLTMYDSPCFPAFVSWWRPFVDSHQQASDWDITPEVISRLNKDFTYFEGLAQSTLRWAAAKSHEISLAQAADTVAAAYEAHPNNAYLTGELPGFQAAAMQLHPALHPLLARCLNKAGHNISLGLWDLALAGSDGSSLARAAAAHLQTLPHKPLCEDPPTPQQTPNHAPPKSCPD